MRIAKTRTNKPDWQDLLIFSTPHLVERALTTAPDGETIKFFAFGMTVQAMQYPSAQIENLGELQRGISVNVFGFDLVDEAWNELDLTEARTRFKEYFDSYNELIEQLSTQDTALSFEEAQAKMAEEWPTLRAKVNSLFPTNLVKHYDTNENLPVMQFRMAAGLNIGGNRATQGDKDYLTPRAQSGVPQTRVPRTDGNGDSIVTDRALLDGMEKTTRDKLIFQIHDEEAGKDTNEEYTAIFKRVEDGGYLPTNFNAPSLRGNANAGAGLDPAALVGNAAATPTLAGVAVEDPFADEE